MMGMSLEKLQAHGIRITPAAENLIRSAPDGCVDALILLNKPFINEEDVQGIIEGLTQKVEIRRPTSFTPVAKEYESKIDISHARDVTGKSRTKGEVADFVGYFRNRYERIAKLLRNLRSKYPTVELEDAKKHVNERVRVIVAVYDKRVTGKGNLLIEMEDLSGKHKAIISLTNKDKEDLAKKAQMIIFDDIIALTGKMLDAFLIVEDIEWPDMPITRQQKKTEEDLAICYLSDIHLGSRYFLGQYLDLFVDWTHGKGGAKELASKLKYIVIAGDLVDGIGIYPNQEKELVVQDIFKQYELFDQFVERLPDHVEVIISPGNHDAVRRGEPMPAIGKDLIKSDVISVGNPSTVTIEGLRHIIYHGTSLDSMIASIPGASYAQPEKVMVEYLKRRHLSPIYGGNPIVPEKVDYLVIDEEPDILHSGHVHKNGYIMYRGTLVINSGTFQDQTEFQLKQGHIPTPAVVPIYETKTGKLKSLDFKI